MFVCYSHREEQRIEAEIAALSARGIRIKYDEGIEPGQTWQDHLAEAIETCCAFLIFISKHSIASDDCRRELTFALTKKRPVVAVHLDDVELPSAMRLQLGDRQAIIRSRFTEAEYRERLTAAMLTYQNATAPLDVGADDPFAPFERTRIQPRRRRLLLATVLGGVAIVATLLAFRSQIGGELRSLDAPAKNESIVVLPFVNASGRDADAYLSEGFSDELRDQLTHLNAFRVLARSSSTVFRGQNKTASAIAKELGVASVVEGSLRKEGDSVHVVVRLIDAETDTQLWSQSYDATDLNMLAVQQKIAVAAAKQILPQVDANQIPRPDWKESVNALMLQARDSAQNAVTPKDWDEPVSLYEKILAVDPQSARAHAGLARALFRQGLDVEGAERHARQAVEIDPNLSEGHSALAVILDGLWRPGAGQEFARAVQLNPGDAEALHDYGVYLMGRGTGDPFPYLRKASNIDPFSPVKAADLAWAHVLGGRPGAGEAALKTIEERFPTANGRFVLARTLGNQAGRFDEAIAWQMEARRLDPNNPDVSRDIAEWLARLGMDAEANKVQPEPTLRILFWQRRYDEIIERMSNTDLDEHDDDELGYLAFALQATGRDEEAIPILNDMGLPEVALNVDIRRIAHLHHLAILFGSLNAIGKTEEARKLARWLEQNQRPGIQNDHGWGGHWWLGCALGVLGKREEALHEIEAMAAGSSLAWMPYLRDAACFRDLHSEPRYQKAVQKLQARIDAMRERLPGLLAQHGFTIDQF